MSHNADARKRSERTAGDLHSIHGATVPSLEELAIGPIPIAGAETSRRLDGSPPPASEKPGLTYNDLEECPIRIWNLDPRTMVRFLGNQNGHGSEEFRALRSHLSRLREQRPIKTLLVTSALPNEGKSFIASNLAHVLALQQGCRVLLIDGDLRSPRLHQALGTSLEPGVSDYLMHEAEEIKVIQRGTGDLFFIPAGRAISGPTELLASGGMKSLIDRVANFFDWIVIDSPATVPVSDACVLATFCDGVLIVVRSQFTPFDVVRQARQRFREEALVGVVLNGTEADSSLHSRYRYHSSKA